MSQRKRKERIYNKLKTLATMGVIREDLMVQGNMPGIRWIFTPTGFGERAMTTNEVEWFIIGAEAALERKRG